jgi:hypothetical protein
MLLSFFKKKVKHGQGTSQSQTCEFDTIFFSRKGHMIEKLTKIGVNLSYISHRRKENNRADTLGHQA